MKSIWVIARNTFLDFIKGKVFYASLFAGVVLLVVTFVSVEFTYGVAGRVCLDIGLGLLSLSTLLFAIILGTQAIAKEVEGRTVFMIVTRPVTREQFYLGKMLGVILLLFVNFSFLMFLVTMLSSFYESFLHPWQYLASFYILMEAMIILFFCSLCSIMISQSLTVVLAILVYSAGHTIPQLIEANLIKKLPMIQNIFKILMSIIPNFHFLNVRDYILFANEIPSNYFLQSFVYFVFYAFCLILLGMLRIRKMNFE